MKGAYDDTPLDLPALGRFPPYVADSAWDGEQRGDAVRRSRVPFQRVGSFAGGGASCLGVRRGLRLPVPFSIVINRLFISNTIVEIIPIYLYTVIDTQSRHCHSIDNETTQRNPVVTVSDTEICLMYFNTTYAIANNPVKEIADIRIVERRLIPRES